MPAHDEHRVRNTHLCRITYLSLVCPAKVGHGSGNLGHVDGYSGRGRKSCNGLASAGPALPLADPAQRRLHRLPARVLRGQVLAVAPGAAGAVPVMPLAARNADHPLIVALSRCRVVAEARKAETGEVVTLVTPHRLRSMGEWYAESGQADRLRRADAAGYAAFARRIRRRRSAERSSSFRPPQVPYFSGRATA